MKGCPRLFHSSFIYMVDKPHFWGPKNSSGLGLSAHPTHTHVGCSEVQPKHCSENFVKQSITALPDSLEKSAGWSRLLPATHGWSEYGLQMLRRLYQGGTAEGKNNHPPFRPLHKYVHTHRVHMQSEQQENCQLIFSGLDLLKIKQQEECLNLFLCCCGNIQSFSF